METSPMETDGAVFETPVEPENRSDEIAPVEICETLPQPPEIEKLPVQQVNMLDVTKLSYEVQQGYRVFVEMSADSYKNVTWPFMEPVDAEALGLWDYHDKIKEPMSFHEIGSKFNNYKYNSITEVIADIRLILENCYRYNGSNHWVSKLGHKMEKILGQKLALLNRSLRDRVSLEATMALKSDCISVATPEEGTGRRRTAPRNSYVKMINGEDSSSLLTRLKIQEDIEERERRRNREKEKKEANLVLLQDLAEWEEKELGADVMKELHSMWEIPSLAGLLFLLKDFLYIQDLSITELELGFVYANKSSLLARIFTALLLTPHQRKSLFKKPPMKFKVWESKLCDRINSWYKATEKDGQELTCHQFGLDMALFEVLGEVNPLLEKSYMDITLHRRVWILKSLCDNSLVRDYDFRDHLATIAPIEQRELFLGNDANNWSYLYFPIFSAADLRIYKQCPLDVPTLSKRKKKVTPPPPPAVVKTKVTPARAATTTQSRRNTRLRKLRNSTPSPEPESPTPPSPPPPEEEEPLEPKNTIAEGFELSAYDIETLKKLCEKFDEPPPPPKKRGRKPKTPTPRKRCVVELHQTLLALLEDLEKYEMSFSKLLSKAKIKIMKESQEPEPEDEPEEVIPAEEGEEWGSEESIGDEIEDAGARNMSSDEDFILEDEEGRKSKTPTTNEDANKAGEKSENKGNPGTQIVLPQKRKAEEANIVVEGKQPSASARIDTDNNACSISIQTAPLKLKKKRKMSTHAVSQTTSTSVPQVTSPGITQANQQPVSHVPAGLKVVKEIRAANVAAVTTAASVNKNVVSAGGINSLATGRIFVVGTPPSTSITQTDKNTSSVRIHPKPVILNKSNLSTVSKPNSSAAVPSLHVQTSSTASVAASSLLSQAGLSTTVPGLGKVMFVTSSGVPLQVLKAVPVSQQPLVQGKTLNTAALGTSSKSSLSTPTGVSVLASSSLPTKSSSGASHLPSSPIQKFVISTKLANILSTVKKTSNVGTTSASPLNPPVILVQRPGAGGVVPLAIKGGAVVMSSTSASQQLVVIRPSSTLTSSTTPSTTTLPSGTSISVLGNAQTALGHKLVLAPTILSAGQSLSQLEVKSTSVVTGNKSVQVAMSPKGMKPSEPKTTSVALGSKPVVTTTAMPASSKVPTTTVTADSNSTASTTTTSVVTGNRSSVHVAMSPKTTTLGSKPIMTTTTAMPASSKEPITTVTVGRNSTATTTTYVVTGNKSVQVAMSPKGMKPSEPKTISVALGSKPVVTTTAMPASSKVPTTTVTVDSNSTASTTTTSVVTGNRSSVHVAMSRKTTTLGSKPIMTTTTPMPASSKVPTTTVTVDSNSTAATTSTSVVTGNRSSVHVAMSPIGMKPSEPKTAKSVALGSKPVVTTTTTAACCTLSKTPTTTVTVGSNSTVLITSSAASESIYTASPAHNKQVDIGTTSSHVTAPNEHSTKMESQHVCSTDVYDTVTRTVASHCDAIKVTDTQTVSMLSPDSDFKLNNPKFKDNLLSSKTIPLDKNCEPGKLADNNIENNDSTCLNEKEKDIRNGSELLLDLTCYETSVSDSAGCEESDDSTPNGLHPDTKTKLPSKLKETDIKVCNGVDSPSTQDTKCEEKELDSVEENHAAVVDQTANGVTTSKTK